MKKILIVNEWIVGGGVEKVMKDLISSIPETEYQITLATFYNDKDTFRENYPDTINYQQLRWAYRVDHYPRHSVRHVVCALCRRFFQFISQMRFSLQNFDVIIAMEEGSCMKFLSKVRARKRLAWVHCDFLTNYWTKGIFSDINAERACMEKYDNVVCVSMTVADHVKRVLGDPGNLCVRYNPIDEMKIQLSAEQDAAVPSAQNRPLFVTVGRLCEAKGYGRLQNVCKRLNDDGLSYELWIIGDGELVKELYEQKENLNLDNVFYLGNQPNPFPYMKHADWFLCSSITEGFSTVLQEATVLGVPIISTECSGTEELLGRSEYGIIVNNTEESLYWGMKKVIEDGSFLQHYRKKAQERKSFVNLQDRMDAIKALM